jgi:hypothetical protein
MGGKIDKRSNAIAQAPTFLNFLPGAPMKRALARIDQGGKAS